MITIVAGSRNITKYATVREAVVRSGFGPSEIVSGGARGVDKLGELYAKNEGLPITRFYVDDEQRRLHGNKAAYLRRNLLMARYAAYHKGGLVLVWDGESTGSLNMFAQAYSFRVRTHLVTTSAGLARLQGYDDREGITVLPL